MMQNGLVSVADTLPLPSLEKGYCWLPSPAALSSTGTGRPPGMSKQESWLKKRGLLNDKEVLNPAILCEWFRIPPNWLDPWESKAGTELLDNNERQLVICWTLESPQLASIESSISLPSSNKFFLEERVQLKDSSDRATPAPLGHRQKEALHHSPLARGCLYRYLENKKLKDGTLVSYPRVAGFRDEDNPNHWRWGYCWEEKIDHEWKNRSISVPKQLVSIVRTMIDLSTPARKIRSFIQGNKSKKTR